MAVLTVEQEMLRDSARTWTQQKSPVSAFRKVRDERLPLGYDPAVFAEIADMGWTGIIIPERYGGFDFGRLSLGLVLEELGRTLTPSPLLSSAVGAVEALVRGGSDVQKDMWLPKIASGEIVGTLAIDEGRRHAPASVATVATKAGAGYTLSGAKTFVLDGMAADLLVVSARTGGRDYDEQGISVFLVKAADGAVSRKALALADSRGVTNITFDGAAAELLGQENEGYPLLESVLDGARAALAAEMLGTALQAFETTVAYLKIREQFGRLIGSFQALQHRAAKMLTQLELARSCVEAALAALDADSPDAAELVSLAKMKVGQTLHLVSREMVQMHGGIGMTDEHDAGFYLKRARVAEATFGDQAFHRARYARLQGF